MKAKMVITAELVRKAIEDTRPTSMTQLAQHLGYKGSVSSSLTRKFRALVPDIEAMLKGVGENAKGNDAGKRKAKVAAPKAKRTKVSKGKPAKGKAKAKKAGKPAGAKAGRYPHDPRNPFRPGAYSTVFDVLASHPDGLEKEVLVRLVAAETGKDLKHAGYDCQMLLSAKPNENGLSNNNSPRHQSCRPGFWIKRDNGHVKLMVD